MMSTTNNLKQNTYISEGEGYNALVNAELDMQNDMNSKASDNKLKKTEDNIIKMRKLITNSLVIFTINL